MADVARVFTKAMGRDEATGSRPTVDAPFGWAAALGAERGDIVRLTANMLCASFSYVLLG